MDRILAVIIYFIRPEKKVNKQNEDESPHLQRNKNKTNTMKRWPTGWVWEAGNGWKTFTLSSWVRHESWRAKDL